MTKPLMAVWDVKSFGIKAVSGVMFYSLTFAANRGIGNHTEAPLCSERHVGIVQLHGNRDDATG